MEKQFKKLKAEAHKNYKQTKQIYSSYLKSSVRFNSKGFWHLIYRSRNKKRDIKSQLLRFRLLSLAVKVIKDSHTLQEYELVKKGGRKTEYFAFIAIVERTKIKVIVKKVGKGKFFFWSVIPNWITSKKRDKMLFKGNLEKD